MPTTLPSAVAHFHDKREALRETRDRWRSLLTPALDAWYAGRMGIHDPYTGRDLYTFSDFEECPERTGVMIATIRAYNDATFNVALDAAAGEIALSYGTQSMLCDDVATAPPVAGRVSAVLQGKKSGSYTPTYDLAARLDDWEKAVLQ